MGLNNDNPSRPGALPFPKAITLQMTLLQLQGNDVGFSLASGSPGVVVPGVPPKINLAGIRQPVLLTIELVGAAVEKADVRFLANPHDAMHFGHGHTPPTGPGTAGGMFNPLTVSDDGRELSFLARNPGDGEDYRANFNYTYESNSRASASGGPIIIND
jgi:hypothetical protein